MNSKKTTLGKSTMGLLLGGCVMASALMMTGCQSSIGGQTLPSGFYLDDDIQFQPSGSEFKLQREAAALKAARAKDSVNN
jgi:hypothetical protein